MGDELLREAHRQVQEERVLDELGERAKPAREHLHQLERGVGMRAQEGEEVPPVDREQLAGRERDDAGAALGPAEGRDLADHVPGAHQAEDHVVAGLRGRDDLERAVDHRVDLVALVSLVEELLPGGQRPGARHGGEGLELARSEAREERETPQELPLPRRREAQATRGARRSRAAARARPRRPPRARDR
jgi:hypothetical protein